MSHHPASGLRFSPSHLFSKTTFFSSRLIALLTLVGSPILGGLAMAHNFFRLPGYENKANGILAIVTGMISCLIGLVFIVSSPMPLFALISLTAISVWLAKATAFDSFASHYVSKAQDDWAKSIDVDC